MEICLLCADTVYNIPNVRFVGRVCRTNLACNTAFRGFGAPQAHLVADTCVDHVATQLGLPPDKVLTSDDGCDVCQTVELFPFFFLSLSLSLSLFQSPFLFLSNTQEFVTTFIVGSVVIGSSVEFL